jgi:hypothetical protein
MFISLVSNGWIASTVYLPGASALCKATPGAHAILAGLILFLLFVAAAAQAATAERRRGTKHLQKRPIETHRIFNNV